MKYPQLDQASIQEMLERQTVKVIEDKGEHKTNFFFYTFNSYRGLLEFFNRRDEMKELSFNFV